MKRVQSSSGVEFQSSAAVTKVASHAPRNRPQKVRLCQLPGSGVGQMRNGGASEGAQQEKIERDAGDEACREDEMGDIEGRSWCVA